MHSGAPMPIFIARDEQVAAFRSSIHAWNTSIDSDCSLRDELYDSSSSIQGLVVLVHGHGGMGKSTLLKEYHRIVRAEYKNIQPGSIVTCQRTESPGFDQHQLQMDNTLNVRAFFADLADKVARALHINVGALKEYRQACRAFHNFREQLKKVPSLYMTERQQRQMDFAYDAHAPLRYTRDIPRPENGDALISSIDTFLRTNRAIPPLWRQEIEDILAATSLEGEEGETFWEPGRLLGEALGCDLLQFATSHPLLLFFDSYENTTEEDNYLRIVMHQAGERVGWVFAGRADRWSYDDSAYEDGDATSTSYQDVVAPGRGLSINLDSPGSGFFSVADLSLYFHRLRVQYPSLPAISSDQFQRILQVTHGIPLGVRILADLYIKDPDVLVKLSISSPSQVVHQLMMHYLGSPEQKEILQLCGLALLQHKKTPEALYVALRLTADRQSKYENIVSHLARHTGSFFDEYEAPFLHDVVRSILRQWLLHRRYEPDKRQLFSRLQDVYKKSKQKVESAMPDTDLQGLFAIPEWVDATLDLIEIQLWTDAEAGIRNALPLLIASSVYSTASAQKLIEHITFFESVISAESLADWHDATRALSLIQHHQFPARQQVQKLETIADTIMQQVSNSGDPLSKYREELVGLLYWKAGDISLPDEDRALDFYLRAWQLLEGDQMLRHTIIKSYLRQAYSTFDCGEYEQSESLLERAQAIHYKEADIYYILGNIYYVRSIYDRAITYYQYAIVIERGRHLHAYMNLANTHYRKKEYQRAIDEYNRVQKLAPGHAPQAIYYNRANAYAALDDFARAKDDYDQAIQLDPKLAWAYGNRGHVHAALEHYAEARADYEHAAALAPGDIIVVWTATWAKFDRSPLRAEDAATILRIAQIDPGHAVAWICRAVASGTQNNDWSVALPSIERALELAPEEGDPHFWKGLIAAYLGETFTAKEEIEKALQLGLPPLFLIPLFWVQDINPEFFSAYARPLLQQYHLY